jgi:hypothetical protein
VPILFAPKIRQRTSGRDVTILPAFLCAYKPSHKSWSDNVFGSCFFAAGFMRGPDRAPALATPQAAYRVLALPKSDATVHRFKE